MFTGLRPVVLGSIQRGLLLTGLWRAEPPVLPAGLAAIPVVLTSGTSYLHNLAPLTPESCTVNLRNL